ncbi:MAG: hypothetical protein HY515_00595, partial [Candidatus Aenigmarchaeota archaeon]|nr:hypothetical protein [Candidatus Aenigmarchaeota archaeon]
MEKRSDDLTIPEVLELLSPAYGDNVNVRAVSSEEFGTRLSLVYQRPGFELFIIEIRGSNISYRVMTAPHLNDPEVSFTVNQIKNTISSRILYMLKFVDGREELHVPFSLNRFPYKDGIFNIEGIKNALIVYDAIKKAAARAEAREERQWALRPEFQMRSEARAEVRSAAIVDQLAAQNSEPVNFLERLWDRDQTVPVQLRIKAFAGQMARLFAEDDSQIMKKSEAIRSLRVELVYENYLIPMINFLIGLPLNLWYLALSAIEALHSLKALIRKNKQTKLWTTLTSFEARRIIGVPLHNTLRIVSSLTYSPLVGDFLGQILFLKKLIEQPAAYYSFGRNKIAIVKPDVSLRAAGHEGAHWLYDLDFVSNDLPMASIIQYYLTPGRYAVFTDIAMRSIHRILLHDLSDREIAETHDIESEISHLARLDNFVLEMMHRGHVDAELLERVHASIEIEVDHVKQSRLSYKHWNRKKWFPFNPLGNFEHEKSRWIGLKNANHMLWIEDEMKRVSGHWYIFAPTLLFFRAHLFTNKDMFFMDRISNIEKLHFAYHFALLMTSMADAGSLEESTNLATRLLSRYESISASEKGRILALANVWSRRIQSDWFQKLSQSLIEAGHVAQAPQSGSGRIEVRRPQNGETTVSSGEPASPAGGRAELRSASARLSTVGPQARDRLRA